MAESLQTGSVLKERYRITGIIGEGAMGTVYQADDIVIPGARWAIKEMRGDDLPPEDLQEMQGRFERECGLLGDLNHTGLPKIIEHFAQDAGLYYVMEFIEGKSLEDMLSERLKPFNEQDILPWILQLLDILEYLHNHTPPIVYRDLKPSNIIITAGGKAKLIDFGIARVFKPDKLRDTQLMGTPGFSAPEQYGTGQTDARSDIYSLGATLYHLLSGRDPREFSFKFPPLQQFNSSVSPSLSSAIARCLEKEPQNRFKSVSELRDLMISPGGQASPASPTTQASHSLRSWWGQAAALIASPWKAFTYCLLLIFCAVIPVAGPFICIAGFIVLAILAIAALIAGAVHLIRRDWKKAYSSLGVAGASFLILLAPFFLLQRSLVDTPDRSRLSSCRENLKTIASAIEQYAQRNNGRYPGSLKALTPYYLREIPTCPAAGRDTYSSGYMTSPDADSYTISCRGSFHRKLLSNPDYPCYSKSHGLVVDPSEL